MSIKTLYNYQGLLLKAKKYKFAGDKNQGMGAIRKFVKKCEEEEKNKNDEIMKNNLKEEFEESNN